MAFSKENRRKKIKFRIRNKITGTSAKPRLAIYRSNKNIYAQLVDDSSGVTITGASSKGTSGNNKVELSKEVGKQIAEKAKGLGIEEVVFDRSGYLYHGRVKAIADGAREGGLKF